MIGEIHPAQPWKTRKDNMKLNIFIKSTARYCWWYAVAFRRPTHRPLRAFDQAQLAGAIIGAENTANESAITGKWTTDFNGPNQRWLARQRPLWAGRHGSASEAYPVSVKPFHRRGRSDL